MTRSALLLAFAALLAAAPAASAQRPPLPREAPSGPMVDRHLDRLPPDFTPEVWTDLPPRPALTGALAVNDRITRARLFAESRLTGAEDVAPGLDGHLYTGTADGSVWRVRVDRRGRAQSTQRIARVQGRVLGLAAYTERLLVGAQPGRGLIALDVRTGRSWVLSDRLDGNKLFFPDAVSVARDGTIYFSEASTVYLPGFPADLLDGRANGRLLRYEPRTGRTSVVADGLYFANGVQVDADERSVLVAESFRFRLTRVWLDDGRTEPFGPPLINGADNIHLDADGRVWVGGSDLRTDAIDALMGSADLRRQIAFAPPETQAAARAPYAFAQVLDRRGRTLASFHDTTGRFTALSTALPFRDHVTFGSLSDQGLAQIPLPAELR